MGEHKIEFQFQVPEIEPSISPVTSAALRLASLAEQLALENRTLVNHQNGRAENVAEHSFMLGIVAPALAEQFFPHLDPNLVARYTTIHDAVEAYAGDTPTHNYADVDHASKEELEAEALRQLKADYRDLPGFVALAEMYDAQEVPEARFVRVVDKMMPLLMHFQDEGGTLRTYMTQSDLAQTPSPRNVFLREKYPEYELLIQAREELTSLAVEYFF